MASLRAEHRIYARFRVKPPKYPCNSCEVILKCSLKIIFQQQIAHQLNWKLSLKPAHHIKSSRHTNHDLDCLSGENNFPSTFLILTSIPPHTKQKLINNCTALIQQSLKCIAVINNSVSILYSVVKQGCLFPKPEYVYSTFWYHGHGVRNPLQHRQNFSLSAIRIFLAQFKTSGCTSHICHAGILINPIFNFLKHNRDI